MSHLGQQQGAPMRRVRCPYDSRSVPVFCGPRRAGVPEAACILPAGLISWWVRSGCCLYRSENTALLFYAHDGGSSLIGVRWGGISSVLGFESSSLSARNVTLV